MKSKTNEIFSSPVIVTAVNKEYSLALAVMLKSIEVNIMPGVQVKIYVLHDRLSQKIKSEIEGSISSEKIVVKWIRINANYLRDLKVDGHITIDTYFRLLIEGLFPQYDKVIYMDADLVINRSICELWNLHDEDKHLLAVPLASKKSGYVNGQRGLPAYKLLGIPGDTRTFNAGVMVINLRLWRRDLVSNQVIHYLRQYKEYVLWWDQDGLNAILYNKWSKIPATWNVITSHLFSFSCWQDSLLSKTEYDEICHSPAIIHFAGPHKPWLPDYEGVFQEVFVKYLNLLSSSYLRSLYRGNKSSVL